MPNNTEDIEKVRGKLNYLGLNLERVPKVLKEFQPFSYRATKSYDNTSYKVYKHISVSDIQILLTPADRLTDLNQKYKLATPVGSYLDSKSQENIEKFDTFLKMLNNMDIKKIEEIDEEQQELAQMLPYEVKYENNYMWQIYYSDVSNQYFMLVPTNETNNNAFFYLLKKQIESARLRKKETIFVPVTYQEYSGSYLVQSQIVDLENYLWYFTKEWPNIFEVYNLKEKMNIKIVGKTMVYGNIQSDYVVTLETKEQALEWYKLVKALFILSTGLPNDYTFQAEIAEDGGLEFWNEENVKIEYASLPIFIKEQVERKKILEELENDKIAEEQKHLEELKKTVKKQTQDFLNKQRQIATFLACKKSFFGKIKYYFGNNKKHIAVNENDKTKSTEVKQTAKIERTTKETKINYTIEDLIETCTKLDGRRKIVKGLQMDRKALELKKANLERKIKNANTYLNEIELHKKSIFEFWKFANKDELPSLNEGEEKQDTEKEKIGKSFVYEEDIEDLGKQMDELQRRKISKNEADSIFAIKQALVSSQILNKTRSENLSKEEKDILQSELNKLKKEYEENYDTIQLKDFDIFGGISEDKTKVKTLHNEKHREIEKNKYKVLNITLNTELEVYIDNLRNALNLVKESLHKITTPVELPIYMAAKRGNTKADGINNEVIEQGNLNIAHLNATQELYNNVEKIQGDEGINFYTLELPQKAPIIFYTNIIYFDNLNQTLPLGMDVSTDVLINLDNYKLEKKREKQFRINYKINQYENKVINVYAVNYKAIPIVTKH